MDYKTLYEESQEANEKYKADDENLSKVMAMIDCGGGTDDIVDIVDKLKEENAKLKADASYNYTAHLLVQKILATEGDEGDNEILQNYRDEMAKIEKIDEDLEDITLVAPYIERLKYENDTLKALVKECLILTTHEEEKQKQ